MTCETVYVRGNFELSATCGNCRKNNILRAEEEENEYDDEIIIKATCSGCGSEGYGYYRSIGDEFSLEKDEFSSEGEISLKRSGNVEIISVEEWMNNRKEN